MLKEAESTDVGLEFLHQDRPYGINARLSYHAPFVPVSAATD
jgi:hypothetical protein